MMSKLWKSINGLKKRIGENEKDEKYREEKIINEGKRKTLRKRRRLEKR